MVITSYFHLFISVIMLTIQILILRALSDIGFQITDFQIHKEQLNMIKLRLLTTGLHRNNHFITYRQYSLLSQFMSCL